MLAALTVRDIVLVDRLELALAPGLNVMTGETGAGKSILLDSLGLALGARADSGLLRRGANNSSVTAEFVADDPVIADLLAERGIAGGDSLVVRRVLSRGGVSRAFINDEPVGLELLRRIAGRLVEIQGQGDQDSLLSSATHRALLDAYAGLTAEGPALAGDFDRMRAAAAALAAAEAEAARAEAEAARLGHDVAELDALDPKPGEAAELARLKALLRHREQIAEALREASHRIAGETGAERSLALAARALDGVRGHAQGRLDPALAALDRAAIEVGEAMAEVNARAAELDVEPGRLEVVDERLFALADAARRHGVDVESLAEVRRSLGERQAAIANRRAHLTTLAAAATEAREAYLRRARKLSQARARAARRLAAAVTAELAPLKLDRATFRVDVERLDEGEGTREGIDRVAFKVATLPGHEPAPLSRVASGGETSRILLALRVVLAGQGGAQTLVFDEIDRGVGGATADAVGARLSRLAERGQVLVVTHSPQVAARALHHWRIVKEARGGEAVARVERLEGDARREEIARMLAGARVTDAARAAAASLIQGSAAGRPPAPPP